MSGVFARLSLATPQVYLPQFIRQALEPSRRSARPSMAGKTCVITGATSGIGRAAAEALAAMGARIVMIARDERRGEAVLAAAAQPLSARGA